MRRQFTAEYKRKIVAAAERCKDAGEIGALLRRKGLYSSREQIVSAVSALTGEVGVAASCDALSFPRGSIYRRRRTIENRRPRRPSLRALSAPERQEVLDVLHQPEYVDKVAHEVYALRLDAGRYLCSPRSMYRILADNQEAKDRRDQARHPAYVKPELLATAPNQVWSWDITRIKGPAKWTYFDLYVILDIFSRFVVGWMLAERENARLARRPIAETVEREGIDDEVWRSEDDALAPVLVGAVALLYLGRGQVVTELDRWLAFGVGAQVGAVWVGQGRAARIAGGPELTLALRPLPLRRTSLLVSADVRVLAYGAYATHRRGGGVRRAWWVLAALGLRVAAHQPPHGDQPHK